MGEAVSILLVEDDPGDIELTRESLPCYLYWGSAAGFAPRKRTILICDSAHDAMAADFDRDGRLDLLLQNLDKPAVLLMGRGEAGGWLQVKLEVRDTGVGMDQTTKDNIFDPFFTTKDSGTGLGLAMTHKIIEEHGGEIQVESSVGQGATFTLTLPGVQG